MKSLIYLFWSILLTVLLTMQAQAQIYLSNEDIFDEAEEYLNSNEYVEALPLYLLLEKKGVFNPHIAYKIGTCYLNIRDKKTLAIPYLEKAAESVSEDFKDVFEETDAPLKALLLLGVAYRIDGQIDRAIEVFNDLRARIEKTNPDYLVVVDLHLERCQNAKLLNAFPGEPRTERLPDQINDEFSNYNPVLVDHDSLLYYMEELKFYDAVMKVRMKQGEWGEPENLTPSIGSDGDHILVSSSADGNTLFLYLYEPLRAGEIYTTTYGEHGWSKITPLNENINTVYHETHASISSDGNTLYFTSNREGGYGGLDIYKSEKDANGEWGPAQNLGPKINTPFNEETPIINVDNEILYFSSQGHLSMGGYDIFYSLKMGENKWRQPINMGAPVSTTDDDLFYYPLDEHVSGLMSRIEDDSRAYDIYRYNSMVFANSPRFTVRGKADDIDSTNYMKYQVAVVQNETGDTLNKIPVSPGGDYEALLPAGDFSLVVESGEKVTDQARVELAEDSPDFTSLIEEPVEEARIAASDSTELLAEETSVKTVKDSVSYKEMNAVQMDTLELRNILYAFDASAILPAYQQYLKKIQHLMMKYPDLNFRVIGHTDAIGPASYNMALSERRALAVVNFLVREEISKNRFEVKGEGENKPVALNANPDGTDNPSGRKLNRRVELIPVPEVKGIVFITIDKIPEKLRIPETN